MTIATVRAGLAANLDTLTSPDLNTYSGYTPDVPTPPAAVVALTDVDYGDAMGHGLTQLMFQVVVFVTDSDPESSQTTLDALLEPTGAGSIIAAIESDRTLGGACDDLMVTTAGEMGRVDLGNNVTAITATIDVKVLRSS